MLRLQRAEGRGGRRRQTVVLLGADRRASHHLAGVVVDGDDGALDVLWRLPGVDAHHALGLEGDIPRLAEHRGALREHRLGGRRRRPKLGAVLHRGVGHARPGIHLSVGRAVEVRAECGTRAGVDADAARPGSGAWAALAGGVNVEEVEGELRPGVRQVRAPERLHGDPAEDVAGDLGAALDRREVARAAHLHGLAVLLGVREPRPPPRLAARGLEQRRRVRVAPRAALRGGGGRGGGDRRGEDPERHGRQQKFDVLERTCADD
mmetsp:Transcript_23303/g.66336  ORF Transcript_23303/g.66336 Transcript_23303/m.66336 type:complete len:264 (-) Transcript_23303:15-806(-)